MKKDALISSCRKYRYHLERHWGDGKPCLFIMLNPSTADESKDDRTIKRCIAYAMSWGYEQLYVINLFALRSTDPDDLLNHTRPNPSDAKKHLETMLHIIRRDNGICVAAWGGHRAVRLHPVFPDRDQEMIAWFKEFGMPLHYLKLTKSGRPCHPLYLPGTLKAAKWKI
jgi:hypothetical protein